MRSACHKAGFTLIELLAGITILIVMVLFLTRVFIDSTSAWTQGTKRVEANLSGRAAVEFMSRELAGALFDGNLAMKLLTDETKHVLGVDADVLCFVTTDQRAQISKGGDLYRQIKAVRYEVLPMEHPDWRKSTALPHRYRLRRAVVENFTDSAITNIYSTPLWWKKYDDANRMNPNATIVENVRTVEFFIYPRSKVMIGNYEPQSNFNSIDDGPPAWIDIVVEVLPTADSIRLAAIADKDAREDYADRVARRYFNRVYFSNYQGYISAQ